MPIASGWRRIKRLWPYTYGEAAAALGVSKRTIQNWVRLGGIVAITDKRPHLIPGEHIIEFLRNRAEGRKTKLGTVEFYCVKCRCAREPANAMVDCDLTKPGGARLVALCGECGTVVNKRFPRGRVSELRGICDLRILKAQTTLKR